MIYMKKLGIIGAMTIEVETLKEQMCNLRVAKHAGMAIMELVNGKADVVVIDSATALQYIAGTEGLKIVEDAETFASEEYGIAIKKGNTELLDAINAVLAELLVAGADGKTEIEKMVMSHMGMN